MAKLHIPLPTANEVREFYLYPDRPPNQNMWRATALIISWFFGIDMQRNEPNLRVLGGAIIIYAISLLMEFGESKRRFFPAHFFHVLFCLISFCFIIFSPLLILEVKAAFPYYIMAGRVLCVVMFLGAAGSLLELHRLFRDPEAEARRAEAEKQAREQVEQERAKQREYEELRALYMRKLTQEGGTSL